MTPNPYAADLNGREPLDALAETPTAIRQLVEGWSDADFERSYSPGKWSARQILVHLAQAELALTTRVRFALAEEGYTAQAFQQDGWMPIDAKASARVALEAYIALRALNLAMWRSLTPQQRQREFTHPEYGTLTTWWVAAQIAGHDIHHLKQLLAI